MTAARRHAGAGSFIAPLALSLAALLSACDPTTRRPTFSPRPEAATTELELAVPAATQALASALESDSVPLARVVPRDGFVETPWLDASTLKPTSARPVGPSVVRLRGWVDPSRYGFSRLTVEVIYRTTVDPSLPTRETEAEVAYANPARARVRTLLGKLGGVPVDQPELVAARPAPRPPADTAAAPEGNARLPIPSPVSVDSGALLRGRRDSITSRAPTAAPNQGQRAAPPPAIVPTVDSTRRAGAADTTRRRPAADTVRGRAAPAPVTPAPVPSDSAARAPVSPVPPSRAPAVRPTARYTVQVAAARTRAEADPIAATYVAGGFPARVVTRSGWLKIWVGDYPTAAAADSARRVIRARQGGAPFVIRQ